ncbi:MAG: hypothetical protein JW861_12695 [Bacteroidales bacterium]|nr:hypothetical protein [Bacteroidales bacterium]
MKIKRLVIEAPFSRLIELILNSGNYNLKGISPDVVGLAVNLPEKINPDPAGRIISATSIMYMAPFGHLRCQPVLVKCG